MFLLSGDVGVGKTYFASAVANKLMDKAISSIYVSSNELVENIVNKQFNKEYNTSLYNYLFETEFLIIDDLGKERPSEWTLEKLFTIINNRYENNLPVVITTNYNRERLRERLANNVNYEIADSIISRLYEMCKGISLNGKDKRKELV